MQIAGNVIGKKVARLNNVNHVLFVSNTRCFRFNGLISASAMPEPRYTLKLNNVHTIKF